MVVVVEARAPSLKYLVYLVSVCLSQAFFVADSLCLSHGSEEAWRSSAERKRSHESREKEFGEETLNLVIMSR